MQAVPLLKRNFQRFALLGVLGGTVIFRFDQVAISKESDVLFEGMVDLLQAIGASRSFLRLHHADSSRELPDQGVELNENNFGLTSPAFHAF